MQTPDDDNDNIRAPARMDSFKKDGFFLNTNPTKL